MGKVITKEILEAKENDTVEFKLIITETDKIRKSVAAFANTQGGRIFIGVNDDGTVVGYNGDFASDSHRLTQICTSCKPQISPKIFLDEYEGKSVLVVEIRKSRDVLHTDIDGRFPHRMHSSSDYMDYYALEQRLEERGIFSKPGQGKQVMIPKEESPPPELSDDDLKFYKETLKTGSPQNKEQVASDVYYLSVHYPPRFRDFVPICVELLTDGNPNNRKTIIRMLDTLMSRSDDLRKDILSQAFGKISELAEKDTSPEVRSYAYSFLSSSDDERSLSLLINALTTLTDEEFKQFNFQNNFIGWQWHVKRKLKKLLKRALMQEMDKPHPQPILMRLKNVAGQLGV